MVSPSGLFAAFLASAILSVVAGRRVAYRRNSGRFFRCFGAVLWLSCRIIPNFGGRIRKNSVKRGVFGVKIRKNAAKLVKKFGIIPVRHASASCFKGVISFLLPSFRAQAEFGKNKSRKFGRGGRFFRVFPALILFLSARPSCLSSCRLSSKFGAFPLDSAAFVGFRHYSGSSIAPQLPAQALRPSLSRAACGGGFRYVGLSCMDVDTNHSAGTSDANFSALPSPSKYSATIRAADVRRRRRRYFRSVSIRPPFEPLRALFCGL